MNVTKKIRAGGRIGPCRRIKIRIKPNFKEELTNERKYA